MTPELSCHECQHEHTGNSCLLCGHSFRFPCKRCDK